MPVLIPPPLCKVVKCDDLEQLTLDEALRELQKAGQVEILSPNIYAVKYDFRKITPSMINDYEYCPRLLWIQAKLGKKLLTHRSLIALIRGRLLHERYERVLSAMEDVLTEYKIELGDMVGVIDLVFRRNEKMIPVEIKSGATTRGSHVKQLQIYIELLRSDFGYLVYRNKVERIERNPQATKILEDIRRVLKSPEPPPVDRERCRNCLFRSICNIYSK
ncbi:MAG: CRISPR-associated protein Cas4 [Thermoproteus sp.]|jgi:CRISPR-associated exonuclease Cas4